MQKIARGTADKFALDWRNNSVLTVAQGETFQVETNDALAGLIEDDSDNPVVHSLSGEHFQGLANANPPLFNPVVGPIYVEGCEKGDVLAVTIDWIDPWRYGFSGILPGIGPLKDSLRYEDCAREYVHVIEHIPGPAAIRAMARPNIPTPSNGTWSLLSERSRWPRNGKSSHPCLPKGILAAISIAGNSRRETPSI